jgi:iturin family lipopeptide synthetase A
MSNEGIAIIGMAGRFPGAQNVEEFWRNLSAGVESIARFTDTELAESGVDSATFNNPAYIKARATLSDVDLFDAEFFGFTPREAALMDPQHRLFLETAWHALENAGYNSDKYPGAIGVYGGLSLNTYLLANLCADPKLANELTGNYQTGEYQTLLGNDKDYLTTRVSYKLNLRGPAMTVQTACSTSLVAVAQACQSLLNFQCDMALAGAASISFPQRRGYFHEQGGLASEDGHCRAFDAKAQGTVFGDGVGIVVLKRLDEALTDGDHVYGVIKGYALNNDGAAKIGYTAPSVQGQSEVIAMAQAMAGFEPETIGYVEAHGTATPMGDPVEIAGLTQAFRAGTEKNNFCALGSVKTNIGHLEVAAGVAGLIKTLLALKHNQIPPSLHFTEPNPQIDFATSPFFVVNRLLDWKRTGAPRRAGVSSFGVGGTNAHVVVEEAPEVPTGTITNRPMHLILLSAKTRQSLETSTDRLVAHLRDHPDIDIANVAYTLQVGRRAFEHRRLLFARDVADAVTMLEKRDVARVHSRQVAPRKTEEVTATETFGSLAKRWLEGEDIDWSAFYKYAQEIRFRVPLPGYAFDRKKHWIEPVRPAIERKSEAPIQSAPVPVAVLQQAIPQPQVTASEPRKDRIVAKLKSILKNLSGQDIDQAPATSSFFDLGFDSLFLTQAGQAFRKEFGIKVTFRQLLEELSTLDSLAAYLDEKLPPEVFAPAVTIPEVAAPVAASAPITNNDNQPSSPSALDQMAQQLSLIAQQLQALRSGSPAPTIPVSTTNIVAAPPAAKQAVPETGEPKRFGPFKPIDRVVASGLTDRQQAHLDGLIRRYNSKTPKSKTETQSNRAQFADPRAVSSFNRAWKEMVYPIFIDRSEGARMWDIDENEYIDLTMGFGTNLLGHAPEFIKNAISEQLKHGMEVGPTTPLATKVASLICELTGMERVAFCNTGSEAVLAAIRVARTVTGRTRIATTSGFHGICDEVLVRANVVDGVRRSLPVAPGIPEHVVRDVLVVDYGNPESLEILKAHAHELAAVLVEPVQSRRPDLQPRAFLHELRKITQDAETALVFDEVITGFRCHPGGAQALFGIRADLATYGKVMGGGLPIGAVAGSSQFMDALDGGQWAYGDNSFPEVGVTFFAGTYIRHPLTMASSLAILSYLKQQGPGLQEKLSGRTRQFVTTLNQFLVDRNIPLHIENFASLFYLHFDESTRWGGLLYYQLRARGLHIWEGRPCFISTAHTDADLQQIIETFKESVIAMQEGGFFPGGAPHEITTVASIIPALPEPALATIPQAAAATIVKERSVAKSLSLENGCAQQIALTETERPKQVRIPVSPMEFSLYFFGNYPAEYQEDKYRLLFESAQFADANGFKAIWLPERHFHSVGGFSPNPSLLAASLARVTKQLQLRGGSVVLPLHHPVRVAEEWSVVDNISNGRVGISIASGWHPNDFIFAPANFEQRRELNLEHLATIQKLWRGEKLTMRAGAGSDFSFGIYPQPKQKELPVWLTCIHADSFAKAGELGMGVLGYLMNQTIDEAAEKIQIYRESLVKHGHDASKGHVTILLHTFVGTDLATTRERARGPLKNYLRSFLDNSQKRLESERGPVSVEDEDVEYLLDRAFNDYVEGKALIGTPESCEPIVRHLQSIGVDEIGCFVDFGVDQDAAMAAMPELLKLKERFDCERSAAPTEAIRTVSAVAEIPESVSDEISIPMVESQMGLWSVVEMDPIASLAYNESVTLRLHGPFDQNKMEQSVQTLVNRHEALRTRIEDGGEMQTIARTAKAKLEFIDVSQLAEPDSVQAALEFLKRPVARDHAVSETPLFRASVAKLASDSHLLTFTFHHVVGNGPSYWAFLEELCEIYGGATELLPVLQLRDFVKIQPTLTHDEDESFWLSQFETLPPVIELPIDRPRPPLRSFNGGRTQTRIDAKLCRALRQVGSAKHCSMFMTLFAAFNTLLHRLTNQEDVVVGVAYSSAMREIEGGANLFANTTNILPLRSRVEANPRFSDYLDSIKRLVLDATEHQDYFFGRLLNKLNIPRDPARPPLFSVAFNYETGEFRRDINGLSIELLTEGVPYRGPSDSAMVELYVNVAEKAGGELEIQCDYCADLFERETIVRWLGHFETLLSSIVADPLETVGKLPVLSADEQNQILVDWNRTSTPYPDKTGLAELFENRVESRPESLAVEDETTVWTYRELNAQANRIAHTLVDAGVRPGSFVGICLERSVELIASMLSVLKADGAYVPIDPEYPLERRSVMLEDTTVLLTSKDLASKFADFAGRIICVDDLEIQSAAATNLVHCATGESIAYVIYTSGSTGQPKGSLIPQQGVARLVLNTNILTVDHTDAVAQISTPCFDASAFEIWIALLNGARLVILNRDLTLSASGFAKEIERHGITTMLTVTALVNLFAQEAPGGFAALKTLVFGGESADPSSLAAILRNGAPKRLINAYGPTEASTCATFYEVHEVSPDTLTIPIGKPVSNTTVYLLDRQMNPVPIGVVGEIYIGGPGVASGYTRKPELTKEKFVSSPFIEGSRLYRTGDLARFATDGNILFLGRVDSQVKLRGFRIEMGEIEDVLRRHPAVRDAVAIVHEMHGNQRLVAYVVANDLTETDLREHAALSLPDYMIPQLFVFLDKLPLNSNGKIDRRALPAPIFGSDSKEYVGPRDELEARLVEIWRAALHVSPIGVTDDFFALGGHSLLGVKIFSEIKKLLGQTLPLSTLFQLPTVEKLAGALRNKGWAPTWAPVVAIQPKGSRPPFFGVHGGFGLVMFYNRLTQVLGPEQPFYGVQSEGLDGQPMTHTTTESIAKHYLEELLRTQPEGPYHLGGYCLGGTIAFEMAQQLIASGKEVALLALFETENPARPPRRFSLAERVKMRLGATIPLSPVEKLRYLMERAAGKIDVSVKKWQEDAQVAAIKAPKEEGEDSSNDVQSLKVRLTLSEAVAAYAPKIFPGKVTLFRAQNPNDGFEYAHDLGWSDFAEGGVEIHHIPGAHETMFFDPNVKILAAKLEAAILEGMNLPAS